MSNLDRDLLLKGLLNTLEEQERCIKIRRDILDNETNISDDGYDMACHVFDEASLAYFKLGFEVCRTLILEPVA